MKKIIVAEDDNFLANAYRVKLSKEGFDSLVVGDGEKLLEALKLSVPDLIILDLIMPGKDGFQVLSEIKSNEAWKSIPVIVASNLGQKEDVDKAMGLGAADFIVKSNLKIEDLIQKINDILTK